MATEKTEIGIHTKLVSLEHPEWGTWQVTKTPSKQEDWYHIRGASGERVLFTDELRRFWAIHEVV